VDSGAQYSLVPASVLRRLGIKPTRTKSFILADGSEIKRSLGEALFHLSGEQGTSPVIFGGEDDSTQDSPYVAEDRGNLREPQETRLKKTSRYFRSPKRAIRSRFSSRDSLLRAAIKYFPLRDNR